MTPPDVETVRPTADAAMEWRIRSPDAGGHIQLRYHPPAAPDRKTPGRPARVEIATGPSSFPVTLTDPAELRRLGWTLLRSCLGLAKVLDGEPPPDEDDESPWDQLDLFNPPAGPA